MKKIACVGYHATGAGVIDDLFREFDNVAQGMYEVETRLLQDPDGISDLEYYLVDNPHRLNSGYALKRYLKYAGNTARSYRHIFGSRWMDLAEEYVNALAKFTFPGYWHGDIWLLNSFWRNVHTFRRGLAKLSPACIRKPSYYNYFPWLNSYHVDLTREQFLTITQDYMEKLCREVNPENREFVVLDQLISPANPARYARYVRDLKSIIVDRDPRDVYIHQLNHKDHVLPVDPEQFCIVYRDNRKTVSQLPEEACLSVTFEQMIYHYDEYVKRVLDFVGISEEHHVRKKQFFDPDRSIRNTKLWEKTDKYREAVAIIEKELPDMLHQFE